MRGAIATALLLVPMLVFGQDNTRLQALKDADQAPRQGSAAGLDKLDWKRIAREDGERRDAVLAMLKAGELHTARDYYNAALIFQHGQTPDDFRVAHALATISSTLDPSMKQAQWLKAASWDRLLQNSGQPQWYGTQYVKGTDGRWMLYRVLDGAVTDAERVALGVPSLEQARARADELNSGR